VRYRTRDLTRLLPPSARSMRRMENITGRSDDMMIIRGVNVFPTQIEKLILKQLALAPHFQLEITRPRTLDELTVLVEARAVQRLERRRRRGRRARTTHQEPHRRDRPSARAAVGGHRALAGQGPARRG
jgi:phenylacetate-CoA ligase